MQGMGKWIPPLDERRCRVTLQRDVGIGRGRICGHVAQFPKVWGSCEKRSGTFPWPESREYLSKVPWLWNIIHKALNWSTNGSWGLMLTGKKEKEKSRVVSRQAFPLPRDWGQKLSCYKHMSDGNIRHETKIFYCLISSKISPSHSTQVIKIIQCHSRGQNLCSTHFLNFHVPSKELPRTGTWWMLLALLVCSLTPSINIP